MYSDTPIARILREARATVHTPQRPETPGTVLDRRFYGRGALGRLHTPVALSPIKGSSSFGGPHGTRRFSLPEQAQQLTEQSSGVGSVTVVDSSGDMEILWAQINSLVPLMRPDSSSAAVSTACTKIAALLEAMGANLNQADKRMRLLFVTLHQLLEHADVTVRIHAVTLLLALTNHSLTLAVAQAIYKLSKIEDNDTILVNTIPNFLSNLLSCVKGCPNAELVTCCAAILKNISQTSTIQDQLVEQGALDVAAFVCHESIRALEKSDGNPRHRVDTIIQITGMVRNLCCSKTHLLVIRSGIFRALFPAVGNSLAGYREVVYNTSRVLSRLCVEQECRDLLLASTNNVKAIANVLELYVESGNIVARYAYVLSVLLEPMPLHCESYIGDCSSAVCGAIRHYTQVYNPSSDKDHKGVLGKLFRALINISVHYDTGLQLAQDESTIHSIVNFLGSAPPSVEEEEDLVLNAIIVLTNLSYYSNAKPNMVHELCDTLLPILWALILSPETESAVESCRLISNLCVSDSVKDWLVTHRVDEAITILLHHTDFRVVQNALGILLNLSSTSDRHGGIFHASEGEDNVMSMIEGFILNLHHSSTEHEEEEIEEVDGETLLVRASLASLALKICVNLDVTAPYLVETITGACDWLDQGGRMGGDTIDVTSELRELVTRIG